MPTTTLHPLEAKFVKLALIRQMIRPSQLRRCHQIHQHRHGLGEAVTLEQVMQQEGLITEDECEELWELIAQSSDTRVRNELSSRRESRPRPSDAARNASRLAGAPEELKGYRLLEMIGSGGMGKVYKARQIAMERDVALKLLPPDLAKNGKYIRRFIREARAAGMLNHANLVRVYDVGEADGRYYISMEYVEGRTVKQYIRREGRVPFLEALKIIEQVAAALDCAHQHKIVHRDIKPDNIMLSPRGDVKLCDLGLAKILEGSLQDTDTQDGQTMGTPHYMSPEQAKAAGDLDGRSDLFSLGATLYHMVTGKVPFDGESSWEILMKVTGEEPVRPDRLEPLLPPPYTRMIQRLMAKSPAERYQNAEEVRLAAQNLRRDLEAGRLFVFDDAPRMLRGQPVPAPTPWRRLPRRPWLAGLAAALAFVLLAALAGRRGSPAAAPLPDAPLAVLSAEAPRVPDAVPDFPLPPAKPPELPEPPPAEPLLLADLASLRDLERRLEQDPLQWPMVLARLEALQPKLSRAAAADIERYQRLKDQVLAAREAQAEAEWKGRLDGAYALMEAGCFTRAAQTLEDVPPLLRGAKVVAAGLPEVLDLVRKSAVEDATARRRRIDELAREGLFEWSDADWRAWQDELKQDGAPAADPRALACREARESLERGKNTLEIKERAFDEARAEARQVLQNVAGLTRAHQFPQARAALEERLQKERSAVAQQLYAAELERLRLVQRLLEKLARAVNEHPNLIDAREFLDDPKDGWMLAGLDERSLHFSLPRGGRIDFPLEKVSRANLRKLLGIVFDDRKWVDPDPAARLALDLEDDPAGVPRLDLVALAEKDPDARQLLAKLVAARRSDARAACRDLLDQAQRFVLEGRYAQAQLTVADAQEALGRTEDDPLQRRAQVLLEEIGRIRQRGALVGGAFLALPRERLRLDLSAKDLSRSELGWAWQGPAPGFVPEAGLAFPALLAKGKPAWTLKAPALVVCELSCPEQGVGALAVLLRPLGHDGPAWSVRAEKSPAGFEASLLRADQLEPAWARANLPNGTRQRLWLRLHVGFVSWGVEERVYGIRASGPHPEWELELLGRGAVTLHGLRVEGRLDAPLKLVDLEQAVVREFENAMNLSAAERLAKLDELLERAAPHPALASRICCELAQAAFRAEQVGTGQYWAARALYECPVALWPNQAAILLPAHQDWQVRREALGRLAGSLENGAQAMGMVLPVSRREEEPPARPPGIAPPAEPPPRKPPDPVVEEEEEEGPRVVPLHGPSDMNQPGPNSRQIPSRRPGL